MRAFAQPGGFLRFIYITICLALCISMAIPTPLLAAMRRDKRQNYKTEDLAAPVLLAPSGATVADVPVFEWEPVDGATRYEFSVAEVDGRTVFRRDGIQGTTFKVPGNAERFAVDADYEFTVRAYSHRTHQASPYAEPMRFRLVIEQPLPPEATLTVTPGHVLAGDFALLAWEVSDAQSVLIEPGIGPVSAEGTLAVCPLADTEYVLTAANAYGETTRTAALSVNMPPVADGDATPSSGPAPLAVTFDGTASFDPDGSIAGWAWDFEANGTIDATTPVATHTFDARGVYRSTLSITDNEGASTEQTVEVRVTTPLPLAAGSVSPEAIVLGEDAMLSWSSVHAESVVIEPGIGPVAANGSMLVSPSDDITYTITVTNESGSAQTLVPLAVNLPPLAHASADPTSGVVPLSVTLDGSASSDADGEIASYAWDVDGDGTVDATSAVTAHVFDQPGVYAPTLVVTDDEGATSSVTLEVDAAWPVPTLSSTLEPTKVIAGESATLVWTSEWAESVVIEPDVGPVDATGSTVVQPAANTTYTITAAGPGGTAVETVRLSVLAIEPIPQNTFGQGFVDTIADDITVESFDPERFSVITGRVFDAAGTPLEGVAVSLPRGPEYGTAYSDADGRYALAVDGGGTIRVRLATPGYLSSSRQLHVPWNDIATVEDVALVELDSASTRFEFDGSPDTIAVHTGTPVADERGTRAASIVLTGDNVAWGSIDGGQETTLSAITVRTTEYRTPDQMPGELPPTSAFTYCVELSADEADTVRFAEPVAIYVDDFLGVPVGSIIPVGFFDREQGVWVPDANGYALRVLDTDGDGIADGLDANDDGVADDIDGDGIAGNETTGLDDSRFTPGTVVWRFETDHFSPWDLNFSWLAPEDAIGPDGTAQCRNPEECAEEVASSVDPRGGVLHEDVPVAGTGMTLHYASSRTDGYATIIEVPVIGETVPESLWGVRVNVDIAGWTFTQEFEPEPNQTARFLWNGLDWRGQRYEGLMTAEVDISYQYPAEYSIRQVSLSEGPTGTLSIAEEPAMFGQTVPRSSAYTQFPSGFSASVSDAQQIRVERPATPDEFGDGWTLSAQHAQDPGDPTVLHTGTGSTLEQSVPMVHRVFGAATPFMPKLMNVGDLAAGPDGKVYATAANDYNYSTYEFDLEAGTSRRVGPHAGSLAVSPQGVVYIAARDGRIYRLEDDYALTKVAGGGQPITDGMEARRAHLRASDIAADAAGNLYVTSDFNRQVYRIAPDGRLYIIAGAGSTDFSDGMDARDAWVRPSHIAVAPDGTVYFADVYRYIRRIDTEGRIWHVAGRYPDPNRYADYDGYPATAAYVNPTGLACDADGRLFINAARAGLVYVLEDDGTLRRVANTVGDSVGGLPAPATAKKLSSTRHLAIDGDGRLFFMSEGSEYDSLMMVAEPKHFGADPGTAERTFPEGTAVGHVTAADGRHVRSIDLITDVTLAEYQYDASERISAIEDRFGNRVEVVRNADGTPAALIGPYGEITTLDIGANGTLDAVSYEDGASIQMTYSDSGLLETTIDPLGGTSIHEYDGEGHVFRAEDADGREWIVTGSSTPDGVVSSTLTSGEGTSRTTSTRVDDFGTTTESSGCGGPPTTSWASADGMRRTVTQPDGTSMSSTMGWDKTFGVRVPKTQTVSLPSGKSRTVSMARGYQNTDGVAGYDLVTTSVTTDGRTTSSANDLLTGTVTATTPSGRTVTSTYDPASLLPIAVEVPGLAPTTYAYDARGRLESVTTGARTTSYTYDARGNVDTVTGPDGRVVSYDYDPLGRPETVTRPDESTVGFDYDLSGNMTSLLTPSDVAHGFDATSRGLRTSYDTPDSGSYTYTYDDDRRLESVTAPSGSTTNYEYESGFLTAMRFSGGSIEWDRLLCGKLDTVTRDGESSTLTYDGAMVVAESRAGAAPDTLAWDYSDTLELDGFSYAGGTQSYTYDADGLLATASPFAIERDQATAMPTTLTAPGFALSRDYTEYGELAGTSYDLAGTDYSFALERDIAGRITERAETLAGVSHTLSYEYDILGRLTRVTRDGQLSESYAWDAAGNRTGARSALAGLESTEAASFDAEDRILSRGDVTYETDADGFVRAKHSAEGTTTYSYSPLGELLSVTLPDGRQVTYTYDASGARTSRSVDGQITERYLWASPTQLLATFDASGALTARFLYADARSPYAVETSAGVLALAYDQVGSVRAVADGSGTVLREVSYDSFGRVTSDSATGALVPLGFAGGLADPDTGLVLFGARDYEPASGRWMAKDPIGFAGGDTNLYAYCGGDPVNLVDPSGTIVPLLVAGFLVGAAVGALLYTVAWLVGGADPCAWNWGSFAAAVVGGGIAGMFSTVAPAMASLLPGALGGSAVGVAMVNAGIGIVSGFAASTIDPLQDWTVADVASNAAFGALGGAAGARIGPTQGMNSARGQWRSFTQPAQVGFPRTWGGVTSGLMRTGSNARNAVVRGVPMSATIGIVGPGVVDSTWGAD